MTFMNLCRALALALPLLVTSQAMAGTYDLTIGPVEVTADGVSTMGIGVNGTIPGPTLRFREGEEVTINVTNNMDEDSSIHWHGILLPTDMDGVPGFSFDGIQPGETFTYTFTLQQNGTYWYHSHSGFQEQQGVFGALIVDPATPDPMAYDVEHVIILSDWINADPRQVLSNLKGSSEFYNLNRRTLGDFIRDVFDASSPAERSAAIQDRLDWGQMRMDPTDIADVSGYTFLMNGQDAASNFEALFSMGERVRLRFINASAMTYFDVKIPGLSMSVVQADGNNTMPVSVDEIRLAVAETYDVIVEPQGHQAYTIFAQAASREGYARGTLTPHTGMSAAVPEMSAPEFLSMADMPGMGGMEMSHGGHNMSAMAEAQETQATEPDPHAGHNMSAMAEAQEEEPDPHAGHNMGGMSSMEPMEDMTPSEMDMPGTLTRLSYDDLVAFEPYEGARPPERIIEVRLTGNMHRYFWTINDVGFDEAEAINLTLGERVRLRFINDTMMDHPMHLHGMWMDLQNGNGNRNPRKHTISIAPGSTVDADVTVDAIGQWAFHCHLIFHMDTGMMRRVVVAEVSGS